MKKIAARPGSRGLAVFDFYPPSAIGPGDGLGWKDLLGVEDDKLPAPREFLDWVVDRVDPASLPALRHTWHAFISGRMEHFDAKFRIRHKDGRWLSARALGKALARNGHSRLTHGIGAVVDVTREDEMDHQRLAAAAEIDAGKRLMGEVDHRAKNLLAVVQSVATLAYASKTSSEEFLDALTGRIEALTKAHDQLAASRWKGVSLRDLVAGKVGVFDGHARSRVRIEGADLNLKPRGVQTLSLVLHELPPMQEGTAHYRYQGIGLHHLVDC